MMTRSRHDATARAKEPQSAKASNQAFVPPDHRVIDLFIKWIERFDIRHARAWAHRYNADPEAATCEAMYWAVLTDCGVAVEPNADLAGAKPAPDFVCRKDGHKFYVEVTCIRIDAVTEHTSLEHIPTNGARNYRPLNDAIYYKVVSKTPQCANLDAPCLLAVGTFHYCASVSCVRKSFVEWLLTGETSLSWHFDPRRGCAGGEPSQSTELKSAAFVRPNRLIGVEPARQPISALLIAGFGSNQPGIFGAVHPYPVREFDLQLLDRIAFCRLRIDVRNATLSTEWTRDPEFENST